MPEHLAKLREWWMEPDVRNTRFTDVRDFETEGFIHVVEYSALEQAIERNKGVCAALIESGKRNEEYIDQLATANAKLETLKDACARRMRSDEACGRHFDEDMGQALAEVEGE